MRRGRDSSESVGTRRNISARSGRPSTSAHDGDEGKITELQKEILDLKVTNRAKDMFIERLPEERESAALERRNHVDKLMAVNQRVGELQMKVLQLDPAGRSTDPGHLKAARPEAGE